MDKDSKGSEDSKNRKEIMDYDEKRNFGIYFLNGNGTLTGSITGADSKCREPICA